MKYRPLLLLIAAAIALPSLPLTSGCKPHNPVTAVEGDAAQKVYVAPGKYDEFYNIVSGGFNGQVAVYGIPRSAPAASFRFSPSSRKTAGGFLAKRPNRCSTPPTASCPWDDAHHIALSTTNGEHDGRWAFVNGNNTPRIARINLSTFRTEEIIEIPNSSGNHSSPFLTENSEYAIAGTRFSYPLDDDDSNPDVADQQLQTKLQRHRLLYRHQPGDRPHGHQLSGTHARRELRPQPRRARAFARLVFSSPATTPNRPTPCWK